MNRSARVTFIVVAALLAAPAAARAATPIVYSSLPLSGADRASTRATVRGAQLALREAGNPFRFASLDDSSRVVGTWTPEKTSENARRASHDAAAIGYIGEFNSGATAISLPVLNEAGIAMISPSNTSLGLTVSGPGTEPGEPAKYYPTDLRTYFRLTPNDGVQGAALAEAMRQAGCTRIAPVDDRELYGRGVIAYARQA